MAEPSQAAVAISYLDKVKLFGSVLRCTASKHAVVQLPKEGQDANLTKDFAGSPLHRFKKPGSKNYANIYAPSATLHLSNIPAGTPEADIRDAFARESGSVAVAFKFFPKDPKMALIQFATIDESVAALLVSTALATLSTASNLRAQKMHNHQLNESAHLRVSFSKSQI